MRTPPLIVPAVVALCVAIAAAAGGDQPSQAGSAHPAGPSGNRFGPAFEVRKPARPAEPLRPVPPASPATFRKPARTADFNGDGYRDTVISSSAREATCCWTHGFVAIVYSGPHGPNPAARQIIDPSTPGIPADNAQVGAATSADFDRDGHADLAVSTNPWGGGGPPGESSVVIFYGSAGGLSGRSMRLAGDGGRAFQHLAVGDFDGNGATDLAGATGTGFVIYRDVTTRPVTGAKTQVKGDDPDVVGLAVADFDGDRRADLAIKVETTRYSGPEEYEAIGVQRAELRLGTPDGLSRDATVVGRNQLAGSGPVAADVDGDGRSDLISGAERDHSLITFPGTSGGLGPGRTVRVPPPDYPEVMAAGDADGDGHDDLAVNERLPDSSADLPEGSHFAVIPGSGNGLSPARAKRFGRWTPGLPDTPGDDRTLLGTSLSLTDLTGDGKADLTVWSPQPGDARQDRIVTLPGSPSGTTVSGATTFSKTDLRMTDPRHNFSTGPHFTVLLG